MNSSITRPRAGSRARGKSPRDLTGQRHQAQLKEQEAKRAAPQPGIEDVHNNALMLGFNKGFTAGAEAFKAALYAMYQSEGIASLQEFMDELAATAEAGE